MIAELERLAAALAGAAPPCASDPDGWFEGDEAAAMAGCAMCPGRVECLAYADAAGARHGVWGGHVRRGRRDFGTIAVRPNGRYRAEYQIAGRRLGATFATREEALAWLDAAREVAA